MSASVMESPMGGLGLPDSLAKRPVYNGIAISQSHRDVTDERYRDLRRPRKVRFYCNGDRYFKGKKVNITPHRYLGFNDLLNDLTGKLPGNVQLPYGVRQIFTPVGGHRVRDIENLQDGQAYVCAGFESFKPIKYGSEKVEKWTGGKPHNHDFYSDSYGASSYQPHPQRYHGAFLPGRPLRQSYPPRRPYAPPGTFGSRTGAGSYWGGTSSSHDQAAAIKPRVITVVRNGPKPRSNVKILLNRRSVQSYEQMTKDIAEAFGPKWKNNRVRKLFTVKGREVQGIADFFRDDDIFIGVGNESLTTGDVQGILEELYPDSPYSRSLLRDWERARRKNPPSYNYKIKDPDRGEELKKEEPKRDSGLGSDSSNKDEPNETKEEVLYQGKPADYYKPKRNKKYRFDQEEDPQDRIEKERVRAADEERERARRRMRRKLEAERRAIDEERRKRAIAPQRQQANDPFKRMQEEREKERQRNEAELRAQALRLEEERLREKARRQRAKSDEEPKVIVVVKGDNEPESGRKSKHRKRHEDHADSDSDGRKSKAKPKREITKPRRGSTDDHGTPRRSKSPVKETKPKEATITKEPEEPKKKPDSGNKDEDNKENEEQKKDKKKTRRSKTIIHKSKLERQISNAAHCLDKYEAGKVLGDGNFAIVKQCKLKNANNEYAMKIIDKSKLKGKEHMIENEIEIMKLCNQPNIVKLYEEFETKEEIYLIMELVKGGDLFDAITQSVKFREPESAGMVSDLANALFYLHSRGIVHRDLKPENLLVHRRKDGAISLKLADFGLAMEVKEAIYTVCGTPTYVAPEILAETGYGLEVDMWAVGVITYILLCGFPPFRSPDRNQTELFEFIKAGEYEFLSPYWDKISTSAKDLISKLLVVERKRRYTAVDALCHPWVITQGGATEPAQNFADYRQNLRRDLEAQAKKNRESYLNTRQS